MSIASAISSLDWATWLRGLIGAGISASGGAIAGGFAPAIVDPDHFNVQHPGKMFATAAIVAGFAALVSIGKFLQATPLPAVKVTDIVKSTTPATATTPKIEETHQEVYTKPMEPPKG